MPGPLVDYAIGIAPGMLLVGLLLHLARPLREPLFAISVLIIGFILLRDAMTPAGLWRIGAASGVPWLRLSDQAQTLLLLGAATLGITALVLGLDGRLRSLVRWGRPDAAGIALGIGGGALAAAPVLALAPLAPLAERGGPVAFGLLPALLFFTLAGNLAEEVLFRGLLQGRLEQDLGPLRSAALSGVLFAACHAPLALVVTDAGPPLLLFTLYEGLICAFLRMHRGVVPAVIAHGLAIFLIGAGLF